MLTAGVDLAADPARRARALVEWEGGRAAITELIRGAGDDVILAALARADKAGIDCPLGWPDAFVGFVADHRAGHVTVPPGLTGQQWRRGPAWRLTDEAVRPATGLIPPRVAPARTREPP